MRILMIDDDLAQHELVEIFLKRHFPSATLKSVYDSDGAIEELKNIEQYKFIILDLMMRRGKFITKDEGTESGIAIYNRIKGAYPNAKIIILSGLDVDTYYNSFKNKTNLSCLRKPLASNMPELKDAIIEFTS